jgi:hypothetical protein
MSAELRGFLAGCGVDNIQYFPAQLISRSDGTVWDNYFAVNIIGVVAAADLKASEYTTVIDRPGSSGLPLVAFEDLKIDPNRAQGLNLFRLAESPSVIIISEALVQRLRSAKTDRDWGLTLDSR